MYEFKVSLLEITPPIWRRIHVPETYTFWDLHVALQDSMGWLDYHLHVFRVPDPVTGRVVQIGIPNDDAFEGDEPILPGWEIPIARHFTRPGVVVPYEYDFGDSWEHELTLEAILPQQPGKKYPVCVGGSRACPPEDCGGVGGYEELLRVMQTPADEEYESTLEWLGGRFDPEKFDPKRVRFDDPARRYELAFGKRSRPGHRGRRRTAPRNTRASGRVPAARAAEAPVQGDARKGRRGSGSRATTGVRQATRDDVPAIRRLMETEPGFWQPGSSDATLATAIESARDLALVWEESDGPIVGFACAHDLGFRAYLSELIVAPRARRRGIGRSLVEHIQAELARRGRRIFIADVWHPAEPFYRALGWEQPDVVLLRKLVSAAGVAPKGS